MPRHPLFDVSPDQIAALEDEGLGIRGQGQIVRSGMRPLNVPEPSQTASCSVTATGLKRPSARRSVRGVRERAVTDPDLPLGTSSQATVPDAIRSPTGAMRGGQRFWKADAALRCCAGAFTRAADTPEPRLNTIDQADAFRFALLRHRPVSSVKQSLPHVPVVSYLKFCGRHGQTSCARNALETLSLDVHRTPAGTASPRRWRQPTPLCVAASP